VAWCFYLEGMDEQWRGLGGIMMIESENRDWFRWNYPFIVGASQSFGGMIVIGFDGIIVIEWQRLICRWRIIS